MNRFDIHVNLGAFPGSRRGKQQRYISAEEMDKYFTEHNITHALVLYNRDEYDLLRELGELTETKVYGVQCIMGKDKETATNVNDLPEWDANIEGRSFLSGGYCYGIKMASNRGWWTDGKEVWSGLDYTSRFIKNILNNLPENALVSMHTQGTAKPTATDTPRLVANLAGRHRHLKFIMNHVGDYGPPLRVSRPGIDKGLFRLNGELYLQYVFHISTVTEGLWMCQQSFNIFGDMSCYTQGKGYAVKDGSFDMWTVGSDFPFAENICSYTKERKHFSKWVTDDQMNDDNAVRFFESNVGELLQWSHDRNDIMIENGKQHRLNIKQLRDNE